LPRYNAGAFSLAVVIGRYLSSSSSDQVILIPFGERAFPVMGTVYWIAVKPRPGDLFKGDEHILIGYEDRRSRKARSVPLTGRSPQKYIGALIKLGLPRESLAEMAYLASNLRTVGKFLTLSETGDVIQFFTATASVPEIPIEKVYEAMEGVVKERLPAAEKVMGEAKAMLTKRIIMVEPAGFYAYVREEILRRVGNVADAAVVLKPTGWGAVLMVKARGAELAESVAAALANATGGIVKGKATPRPVILVKRRITLEEVYAAIADGRLGSTHPAGQPAAAQGGKA